MAEITTRICDHCGVDSSIRAVQSYKFQIYRRKKYIAVTSSVDMCNPCGKNKLNLVASTLRMTIQPKRGYKLEFEETPTPTIKTRQ